MSSSNTNAQGEGIVESTVNTVKDNVNWAANKLTGNTEEAQRRANQEQAKHGNTMGDKLDGAVGTIKHGTNEATDKTKADYYDGKSQTH
ncbi:Ras- protein rsr1 [Didymosphaeria variabile]|uniref:Ras- protein rsr1 n=1 Tax=Didymosphaeria variabile TaxID=1932322 RepID=A0A9W8XGA0_9PLEO|nr:Ras- protein rsr1 [Didymosphaeria variabile]KAJ4350096.1 Ras- protein rsr1 [Didymosphaeria variabile]